MPARSHIITGPRIKIQGNISRHEIVKKVVNQFIKFEYSRKGAGIKFQYPVECLSDRTMLMIGRPGRKKNFDFKVIIEPSYGLGAGLHEDVVEDFCEKAKSRHRDALLNALSEIYHCSENDVDVLIPRNPELKENLGGHATVEILLKVLKWMFIMEDIVYWDNEGRAFLYNYLNYVVNESDKARLKQAQEEVTVRPVSLKKYMRQSGLEWTACKG